MVNFPPDAEEPLNLAIALLSSTTVVASFYTLVLMLYCLSFRLSYAQLWDDHDKIKRQTACTLLLQTLLLICATLDVIVCNCVAQVVIIDTSTRPGGPLSYPAISSITTLVKLDSVMNNTQGFLILGVLLWRVRVIWSGTRFVIPLTIISLFLYLVDVGLTLLYEVIAWRADPTSPAATHPTEGIIFITSSVSSLASFFFMTSAIIARLVSIRRKHIKLMGKSENASQYLSIAAMLIESYALDTSWTIGSLISACLKYTPTINLFNNCAIQVDILTNFLVIYRVLSGRAWTEQTESRLSSLRWASNGASTTNSGTVGLVQTNTMEEDSSVISCRNDL